MKWLSAAFKSLKMVMSGEVVAQMDTVANGGFTRMSLRLKKNGKSGEFYVVLAEHSSGNHQYVVFTRDEFGQFSEAVNAIQESLRHNAASKT